MALWTGESCKFPLKVQKILDPLLKYSNCINHTCMDPEIKVFIEVILYGSCKILCFEKLLLDQQFRCFICLEFDAKERQRQTQRDKG